MKLAKILFWLLILLLPLQVGKHFWPEESFVLGLKIDYLSPTLYLTDILIIIILFFWFLTRPKFKINFLVISFFSFLLVSLLFAQSQTVAFFKLIKVIELFLLGFFVAQNKFRCQDIAKVLVWPAVYSSFIAVAQFINKASLGGAFWFLGERSFNLMTPGIAKAVFFGRTYLRPYASFSHPNSLAGFLLVSLILSFPYLYKKNHWLAYAFILLSGIVLLFSFSAAVWLTSIIIALMILAKKKGNKVWLLIIFWPLLSFKVNFWDSESWILRQELNKISLQMTKDAPLIGVGLNNFIVALPEYLNARNIYWLQPVHNIYLLILAEIGIIGLVIFGWLLLLSFNKLKSKPRSLFLSFLAILILGLADHYWLTLQQNQVLFAVVGGLVWAGKSDK